MHWKHGILLVIVLSSPTAADSILPSSDFRRSVYYRYHLHVRVNQRGCVPNVCMCQNACDCARECIDFPSSRWTQFFHPHMCAVGFGFGFYCVGALVTFDPRDDDQGESERHDERKAHERLHPRHDPRGRGSSPHSHRFRILQSAIFLT